MLTIFTIPKAFRGHFAVIQSNAIQSWMQLGRGVRIILLGNDEGTAEFAAQHRLAHLPDIRHNEYGTPLLNDVFAQAEAHSGDSHLCYVNADIILTGAFRNAFERLLACKRRFLMVGERTDFDQIDYINFRDPNWENELLARVDRDGRANLPTAIDYFVFRRGLWGSLPPFAIGRFSWDNWLIYRAIELKVPVIDVSSEVTAIHQNHDYSHARNGAKGARRGPEARLNFQLAGGMKKSYTIWDSTHVLTDAAIVRRDFSRALGGGIWSYRRSVRLV